jgi:hypothetical protein
MVMSKQGKAERRAWTRFIEERESEKKAKRPRAKKRKPQPSLAELEAALDDLVTEAEQRRARPASKTNARFFLG